MSNVPAYLLFNAAYAIGEDFDWDTFNVDWFCEIGSEDVARARLEFLYSPGNVYKLCGHGFGGPPLNRMWRAVLRAALAYGIPLKGTQKHMASELGIVVP